MRDRALLAFFISYFNCGYLETHTITKVVSFCVTNFDHLYTIIIPFFSLYPIYGQKAKELDGCRFIAKMMFNKEHLTDEGLIKIRQIKSGMNKGRLT